MGIERHNPMDKISYDDKKAIMIELIGENQVPEEMIDQFINLIRSYSNFMIATALHPTVKNDERVKFINKAYNATNLINKFLAITSNGQPFKSQVSVGDINKRHKEPKPEQFTTQPKSNIVPSTTPINGNPYLLDKTIVNTKPALDMTLLPNKESLKEDIKEEPRKEYLEAKEVLSIQDPKLDDIISEEIKSWGLSEDKSAYKYLKAITSITVTKDDTPKSVIAKIAKSLNVNTGIAASNISKAFKAADFSGSKYIPIIKKIKKEDIDKEYMIQQLMDFCVEE